MENELNIIDTVTNYIGKKGRIAFIDTNLAGSKRVMVNLYNEAGTKLSCFLGTDLSAQVRNHEVKVRHLVNFSYAENERGHIYIVRPMGTEVSFDAKDIKAEAFAPVKINVNDYISL